MKKYKFGPDVIATANLSAAALYIIMIGTQSAFLTLWKTNYSIWEIWGFQGGEDDNDDVLGFGAV
jgi:hypothetical protein